MNFTLNRDHTHASVLGHAIEFVKDVPTLVPPALYTEVRAIGALPEEDLPEPETPANGEPTDPGKRTEDILAAIELVATRNTRTDFGANGCPTQQALTLVLGWKPTAAERSSLWARFQADAGDK